jgi:probable rRNA maturation factor
MGKNSAAVQARHVAAIRAMIDVSIANEQSLVAVDEQRLREAVLRILTEEGFSRGAISLAIVDDAAIRPLNARYLGHDDATDVLSFVLEADQSSLEGEVVVSAETAVAVAARFGWEAEDELLLYVVHGTLHLAGYDDTSPERRAEMRLREQHHLAQFGLQPHYDDA